MNEELKKKLEAIYDKASKVDDIETGLEKATSVAVATSEKVEEQGTAIKALETEVTDLKTKGVESISLDTNPKLTSKQIKQCYILNIMKKAKPELYNERVPKHIKDMVEKAYAEGSDATGGYFINDEISTMYIDKTKEYGIARNICMIYPTTTDTVNFPTSDKNDAYFIDEAGSIGTTNPSVGNVSTTVKKIADIILMSEEFVMDAPAAAVDFLIKMLAVGFAYREDYMVFAADGSADSTNGSFTGLLNNTSIGSVTLASGSTFASLTVADLSNLIEGVANSKYKKNGSFVMHPSLKGVIRKLTDDGGYIWRPSEGDVDRIWGYPVYYSEVCPSTSESSQGSTAFVVFGDFSELIFVDRMGYSVKLIDQLYAATAQFGFRGMERVAQVVANTDAFARLLTNA